MGEKYSSSEDEMDYNQRQVLEAAGRENINKSTDLPLVNPNKNPNIKIVPAT